MLPCTRSMLEGSLQSAVETDKPPAYEPPALGTRRTMFLSGMYGSEVIEVVSSYKQAGGWCPCAIEGVRHTQAASCPLQAGR